MSEPVAVEFEAEVRQVRNMVDGTFKLELNLPEYAVKQASWLLEHNKALVKCVVELDDGTVQR
jgi:hypothetical protein